MIKRRFIRWFFEILALLGRVFLRKPTQLDTGLVPGIPNPGRADNGAETVKIAVRAALIAIDVFAMRPNQRVRHDNAIRQIHFTLRD